MFTGMKTFYVPEVSDLKVMVLRKDSVKLISRGIIDRDNVDNDDKPVDSMRVIIKDISYFTILKMIKLINLRLNVNDEWIYVKHDDLATLDRLYKQIKKENKKTKVENSESSKVVEEPKETPVIAQSNDSEIENIESKQEDEVTISEDNTSESDVTIPLSFSKHKKQRH